MSWRVVDPSMRKKIRKVRVNNVKRWEMDGTRELELLREISVKHGERLEREAEQVDEAMKVVMEEINLVEGLVAIEEGGRESKRVRL